MGGMFGGSGQVENQGSGTVGALGAAVTIPVPSAASMVAVISGTWVGTLSFEGSVDGTTFYTISAASLPVGTVVTTTTANGTFGLSVGGHFQVRIRASAYTSGTATVTWNSDSTYNDNLSRRSIAGATTGTVIGNISDRLKVDTSYTGSTLRVLDMNASNGGVARDTSISSTTTYTNVLSVSGTGYLFSLLVTLEGNLIGADPFNVRVQVDGTTVLEINTLDLGTATVYDLTVSGVEGTMGMSIVDNSFRYSSPGGVGLRYSSSLVVSVKKASGTGKRFRAGMAHLTVE